MQRIVFRYQNSHDPVVSRWQTAAPEWGVRGEIDLVQAVGSNPDPIEKKFNKSVDIYAVQQVLAAKSK